MEPMIERINAIVSKVIPPFILLDIAIFSKRLDSMHIIYGLQILQSFVIIKKKYGGVLFHDNTI